MKNKQKNSPRLDRSRVCRYLCSVLEWEQGDFHDDAGLGGDSGFGTDSGLARGRHIRSNYDNYTKVGASPLLSPGARPDASRRRRRPSKPIDLRAEGDSRGVSEETNSFPRVGKSTCPLRWELRAVPDEAGPQALDAAGGYGTRA